MTAEPQPEKSSAPPATNEALIEGLGLGGFFQPDLQEGLSLDDLGRAYAELMAQGDDPYEPPPADTELAEIQQLVDTRSHQESGEDLEVSPRGILEAMLFVGDSQNRGLSARMIASFMRGVRPEEIDELVTELNEAYLNENAPYEIVFGTDGYRMTLRERYRHVSEQFLGKVREAKLTQAAVDVLSIVAYRQPIEREAVDKLRGAASGAVINQLIRRRLLRLENDPGPPRRRLLYTTPRFLDLFGLERLEDLPQSQDLDRWPG